MKPRSNRAYSAVARLGGRLALVASVFATMLLGTLALSAATATSASAAPLGPGYALVAADGGIFNFGQSQYFGSTGGQHLNKPIVGAASTPFLEGYWLVASDGGIFNYGSAGFYGSTGARTLNKPVVGMASTSTGTGYWLVASDGGIFSFGDATFYGSMGGTHLNKPIVEMAATPSGHGYWLVASDGGIFSFGDAGFFGSTGALHLNKPIVGMASTPNGGGYWLVASDGGIFTYGNAGFFGSAGALPLNKPVVGMSATANGGGYLLVASDGGIFTYGNAVFFGSMGGTHLNQPMVGMFGRPPFAVKVDPYVPTSGQSSNWVNTGSGYQLQLNNTGGGSVPAGARVLGVEGLNVSQLQTLGFTVAGGTCTATEPYFLLNATDPTTHAVVTRSYGCANGGGGGAKSFNPVSGATGAAPLSGNDVVTSLDIVDSGAATNLTNIVVAGLTITDFRTFTSSGTIIG